MEELQSIEEEVMALRNEFSRFFTESKPAAYRDNAWGDEEEFHETNS